MSERISALFVDREDAERAAAALLDRGVTREEIALVGRGLARMEGEDPADAGALTVTSPADAAAGAVLGAGTGAALGLLGTILLVIPGVGPLVAAGSIAAALAAGTGVGAAAGAVAGGVYGALRDMGMPEEPARIYESGIIAGSTLISVRTIALLASEIREIFEKYNALQITTGPLPDPDPNNPVMFDEQPPTVAGTRS